MEGQIAPPPSSSPPWAICMYGCMLCHHPVLLGLLTDQRFISKESKQTTNESQIWKEYQVIKANTERLKNSKVPYIQRLLNTKEQERKKAAPSYLLIYYLFWSNLALPWYFSMSRYMTLNKPFCFVFVCLFTMSSLQFPGPLSHEISWDAGITALKFSGSYIGEVPSCFYYSSATVSRQVEL